MSAAEHMRKLRKVRAAARREALWHLTQTTYYYDRSEAAARAHLRPLEQDTNKQPTGGRA